MMNHTQQRVNMTSVTPNNDVVDRFLLNVLDDIMQRMYTLPSTFQSKVVIILTIFVAIILLLQLVKYICKYATQRNTAQL